MFSTKIGDGTAPAGFPAYSAYGSTGVRCDFNGCGHKFENGQPCIPIDASTGDSLPHCCAGLACPCPCCRMLAGAVVHGCTYGERTVGRAPATVPISEWQPSPHFVCRACGTPARMNPLNPKEWGCAKCGGSTHSLSLNFQFAEEFQRGPVAIRDALIQHCWTHSGQKDCGYEQMSEEQKQLFNSIVKF